MLPNHSEFNSEFYIIIRSFLEIAVNASLPKVRAIMSSLIDRGN